MKINLYEFLDMVGNIEVSVYERLDNGKETPLFIGYPEELQEHLKLAFSTTRYNVIFIPQTKNDLLILTVAEE